MTKRAYWCREGWLWEESPTCETMLLLVWHPGMCADGRPLMRAPRRSVERASGPLVGVA